LQRLVALVDEATIHTRTSLFLVRGDAATVELAAFAGSRPLGEVGERLSTEIFAADGRRLLEEGSAGVVDFDREDVGEPHFLPDSHLMYLTPIARGGQVFGAIMIDDPGMRQLFTRREMQLVDAVASQGAIALENARIYQSERDIAERLQSAMLAMPESVGGVTFAHRYSSASETARVGGDFYDLFELDDGLLGITIGDIAGKGLNAAVLTSLVKNSVRAHATEKGSRPGRILELTNEVMYRGTQIDAFATVFFAVLDRKNGFFEYSNAGHTTGFLLRADGSSERLTPTGPILGAFSDVGFDERHVRSLKSGDMLFLYTDGIIEAREDSELYGEERLLQVLLDAERNPEGAISAVLDDVLRFTDGRLSDDVAVLAVRFD